MDTRSIATAAVFGALWGVINYLVAPYVFRLTRLPFFCDIIGLVSLLTAIWVARKPGTGTLVGLTATFITLILRPGAFYFFGFTAASVLVDVLTYIAGYRRVFDEKPLALIPLLSLVTAAAAGLIIGAFFMHFKAIAGVLTWTGLHAVGGLLGALVAIPVIKGLGRRLGRP